MRGENGSAALPASTCRRQAGWCRFVPGPDHIDLATSALGAYQPAIVSFEVGEAAVDGILIGYLYLPNGNPAHGPKFDFTSCAALST